MADDVKFLNTILMALLGRKYESYVRKEGITRKIYILGSYILLGQQVNAKGYKFVSWNDSMTYSRLGFVCITWRKVNI